MTQPTLARSNVRILIIEDHALFAESLDLALTVEGYDVRRLPIPETGTSQGAVLSAALRLRPRIVLLDLDLGPVGDGVRLIAPLVRSGAHVVVVTASPDKWRLGECLWYGARKVLTKARPLNEILATVRRLNQGLPVMDRDEREELLRDWHEERQQHEEHRTRLQRLTAREREVLGHLMVGQPVRDIARISVVSEATVRTQVKSILAKLEVSSQLAAVGLAHAVSWKPPST
jgi:two-component system, NarL family, nitrate/nitrite response regulator NarL